MMNDILLIGGGLLAGFIIMIVKDKVFTRAARTVGQVLSDEDRQKMIDLASKGLIPQSLIKKTADQLQKSTETFNAEKLKEGLVALGSGRLWGKTLAQEFSLRTWIVRLAIVGILFGVIYGYGWYKGRMGAPVTFDMRGKEAKIQLNEHFLHILSDGTAQVEDRDGTVLKKIKVQDIPELRKALKPFGIDIHPFVTVGGGVGANSTSGALNASIEGGAGLELLKWFKWHYNVFITNKAAYPVGISYRITDNFDILGGIGMEYGGGQRAYIGGKWKF